jgi:DNA-binding transcriptional ArsR family regulator
MPQTNENDKLQKNGNANQFSSITSLIGEPARATMLWKMLEGKAFTATELAVSADVSAQSASMHLTKLVNAKLLAVATQGRHKYYRLASAEVAYVLESISNLVPNDKLITEESKEISQHDIKYCRTCYDHLAGRVGVALTDRLEKKKIIVSAGQEFDVSSAGAKWFGALDISVDDLRKQRRAFARKCLDWSERRYHLSGSLGASLFEKMIEMKWLRRIKESRRITLTTIGQEKMYKLLGLNL